MKYYYEDIPDDQFVPVNLEGFEDLYEINKNGEVRRTKTKRKLKFNGSKSNPYLRAKFWKKGKIKDAKLHRLLALTFIPNDNIIEKFNVNHIDENILNNKISNLEWCTTRKNTLHSIKKENKKSTKARPINMYENDKFIKQFKSINSASKKLNIHRNTIILNAQGKIKLSIGKYSFKFADEDKDHPIEEKHKKFKREYKKRRKNQIINMYENGKFIKQFESINSASKKLNISYKCIHNNANGIVKLTLGKYSFKYADEDKEHPIEEGKLKEEKTELFS